MSFHQGKYFSLETFILSPKIFIFSDTNHINNEIFSLPPNHRLVAPVLNNKSPPSWGYESTRRRWFLRLTIVPSQQANSYNHSNPPTLFPLNLHNPRNGIPFSATQSLRLSHFPPGLQHRLARKYLYWGLQEFTTAT
jgi:hypothetical protein